MLLFLKKHLIMGGVVQEESPRKKLFCSCRPWSALRRQVNLATTFSLTLFVGWGIFVAP